MTNTIIALAISIASFTAYRSTSLYMKIIYDWYVYYGGTMSLSDLKEGGKDSFTTVIYTIKQHNRPLLKLLFLLSCSITVLNVILYITIGLFIYTTYTSN